MCADDGEFFFSSRRRHTRLQGDWSSDVCSSDLVKSSTAVCKVVSSNGGAAAMALSTNTPLMTAPAIASAWESDNFLNPVFIVTCSFMVHFLAISECREAISFQDQANRRSPEMNRRKVEANRRRLETTSEELIPM